MAQPGCYNSMKRLMWKGTFRRGWPRLFKDTAFALHCFLQMNTDLKSQITVPKKTTRKTTFQCYSSLCDVKNARLYITTDIPRMRRARWRDSARPYRVAAPQCSFPYSQGAWQSVWQHRGLHQMRYPPTSLLAVQ